jgi:membrane fusion protein (multidrug efflux system)
VVTVSAEIAGRIIHIGFTPGAAVKAGGLLIQLDADPEEAQLRAAEATAELARLSLARQRDLLSSKSVAQAEYDTAEARYRQAMAEADAIRAVIAKKTIRAPFAGKLGIRLVDLGQILKEGDPIVSLQSLDPIFVDFQLPQNELGQLQPGLTIRVTADSLPGQVITGRITAINPEVDSATRNIRVQATVDNPHEQLRPGMFVNVAMVLPRQTEVLVIPATAVLYAPYGDSVFLVEETKDEKAGQQALVVRQQFIRTGEKRGDFITVTSGLKSGETVVSTGVFKLRNGQAVVIDNALNPEFSLAPRPDNS